ncbi:hypothetical protein E8E14_009283 [Neopestalotiopsis sp. 37M]|nr:hypothetical protein E8E14_009283 [Neopestalotiopsis sp. 37M]
MSSHKDELLLRSPHDMNAPFQDMSRWNERPMSLAEAFLGTTRTFPSSVSDVSADCSSDVADCGADCQHCALQQQQDVSSSLETQAQEVATTTTQDRPGFAPASFEYNDYKLYNGKPAAQSSSSSSSSSSSTPLPRSLIRERDDVPRSWHIEHAEFPSLTKLYPEAEPRETSLHHKPSPQQSIKAVVNGHVTTPRSAPQSMDSNMKKKLEPRAMKETNDTAARIPARRCRIVWQPPSAAVSGKEDVVPANAQDHHPEQDSSQPTTAGLPPTSGGSCFAGWPTYSAADDGWYSEPDPTQSEKYGADDGNDASPSSSSSSSTRRGVQLNDNDVLSIRLRLDDDKQ